MSFVSIIFFLCTLVLLSTTWNAIFLSVNLLRKKKFEPHPRVEPNEWPSVCVQLPIYNEEYVVESLLDHVSRLQYPDDKLEIQVLDDSTDRTTQIIRKKLLELNQKFPERQFTYLHRENREGYKAGNLQYGFERTDAQYVAVLDADSRPEPDFLTEMMMHLAARPHLDFAQARLSLDYVRGSWLGPMIRWFYRCIVLFQVFRQEAHSWIQFNGTGGVISRRALSRLGGWHMDTVGEDVDLTYRMQLNGILGVYVPYHSVKCEFPQRFFDFLKQQRRWSSAGVQILKKHLLGVLQTKSSFSFRSQSIFALMGYNSPYCHVIQILLSFPVLNYFGWGSGFAKFFALYLSSLVVLAILMRMASRKLPQAYGEHLSTAKYLRAILLLPGMFVNNSVALRVLTPWAKPSFTRTPKFGDSSSLKMAPIDRNPIYVLELAFVFVCAYYIVLLLGTQTFSITTILYIGWYSWGMLCTFSILLARFIENLSYSSAKTDKDSTLPYVTSPA